MHILCSKLVQKLTVADMLYIGLDTQQKHTCKRNSKKWPKSQLCGFERLRHLNSEFWYTKIPASWKSYYFYKKKKPIAVRYLPKKLIPHVFSVHNSFPMAIKLSGLVL